MRPSSSSAETQNQVADRMPGQRTAAAEPVLNDGRPQPAVRAVGGQRRQRHPEVAGRHHIQFAAQPAGRAAVVGYGDHGRDVRREPAGRRQCGVKAVPAAQRDDS
jgi:hypothetical protein